MLRTTRILICMLTLGGVLATSGCVVAPRRPPPPPPPPGCYWVPPHYNANGYWVPGYCRR